MRDRSCSPRLAGMALALLGLALFAPRAARADDLPNYLYRMLKSSANQLTVMGANANSVLVRERGTAGDALTVYNLDGTGSLVAAAGQGVWAGRAWRFPQAAMNQIGDVVVRASALATSTTTMIATALYDPNTGQTLFLQSIAEAPNAVANALASTCPDIGDNAIVRQGVTTGAQGNIVGSFVSSFNLSTRTNQIIVGTGSTIAVGTAQETVQGVAGDPGLDKQGNAFVPLSTGEGHIGVGVFTPVANGWQQSGYVGLPDDAVIQQAAYNKDDSDLPAAFQCYILDPRVRPEERRVLSALAGNRQVGWRGSTLEELTGGWGDSPRISAPHADGNGQFRMAVLSPLPGGPVLREGVWSLPSPDGSPNASLRGLVDIFRPGQPTSLDGPASSAPAAGLERISDFAYAFVVHTLTRDGVVVGTPIPAPNQPLPFDIVVSLAYREGGSVTEQFLLSGAGTSTWGSLQKVDDDTLALSVKTTFVVSDTESNGFRLRVDGSVSSQVFVSGSHFYVTTALPASMNGALKLTLNPLDGSTLTFPDVTVSEQGQYDPYRRGGRFIFPFLDRRKLAENVFKPADDVEVAEAEMTKNFG